MKLATRRWARLACLLPGFVLGIGACSKPDGGGPGPTGPVSVATLTISPAQVSVQIGATQQLTAETRDASGNLLTGRTITWSSTNPNVASVSTTGLVTGVGQGSARIAAAAEGKSTDVPANVTSPPIAVIEIAALPTPLFAGQTVQLTATAKDAAGRVLTGKTFVWSTSNSAVAQVSSAGLVTAVTAGNATIGAAAEGITGNLLLSITPAPAVLITQVSPGTLVEGQAGTITGSGFSTTAGSNTVQVDGVNASVTQATSTTLQFLVPAFDCRPKRSATVRVTVGANTSNTVSQSVSPASFVSLTVGQEAIVQDPADRCLQFDATNGTERYVIGVQAVSDVVATLTPVTVTGGVPSGSIVSSALPAADRVAATTMGAATNLLSEDHLRWQRHMASTVAAYERHNAFLQRLAEQSGAQANAAYSAVPTIPGTVREGDQIPVRYPNYGGNTCTQFTDITVRVRRITAQAIFLEDIANPEQLAQAVIDQAGVDFTTLYAIDVDHFGAPSDIDLNQRIAIIITKEVNKSAIPPLGFVSFADLFTVAQCASSNEGEVFYMRSSDPSGQFTAGVYTSATLTRDLTNLLAHEFTHIIQGSRRRAAGGPFMISWLAEGLATSAQELAGFQVLGLQSARNYGRSTIYASLGGDPRNFFGFMGDLLAYFGFDFNGNKVAAAPEECSWVGNTTAGGNPGPCSFAIRLLYGVPWSLIKYTIDRHLGGAANQKQYLRAFSDYTGAPGLAELQGVLGRVPSQMLAQWAAMLYIDDRYPALSALQLANWNIRDIAAAYQSPNADLVARSRAFAAFTDNFNVRAGSTAYYEVSGAGRTATALRFRGQSGIPLPPFVQIWIVRVQ